MQLTKRKFNGFSLLLGTLAVCLTAVTASAQQKPVVLGSASTFAILAGSGDITFTGGGTVTGNIGLSPGTSITGVPPTTVNGTEYAGGPIAAQAQIDLANAITDATNPSRGTGIALSGDIGGMTLVPGLYTSGSSMMISSGDLILDAQGDANAVFIFQMPSSTFLMATGRQVFLVNGANANNIFWQVGSSATLMAGAVLHGNILAGASITLDTGATLDGRALAQVSVTIDTGTGTSATIPAPPAGQFVPVPPCRVVDTRNAAGAFGGPFIAGESTRSFTIPSGSCGIPTSALTYSLNIAVVPHGHFAYLTAWPTGQTQPLTTTLSSDGRIKSGAAIVPAGAGGAVSVFVTNDADVVLDINGYFAPLGTAGALTYYPVIPCRISDTRKPNGPLGGPFLSGQTFRTIPVLSGSCSIPGGVQAYSLNIAAVPHGPLGYLTAWATGSVQPYVASLNASTGTTTSNAAIVPAGTGGSIDIFASNDTDLVVDINGYFAAPGAGGLMLYGLTPCRALDTRLPPGALPFSGAVSEGISSSDCGIPLTAQAYVFTATAVPSGPLGYLTLWDDGGVPPVVASLNALDGAVTSDLAIVPTDNGMVDAFASNPTYLVLDIFGYFAP